MRFRALQLLSPAVFGAACRGQEDQVQGLLHHNHVQPLEFKDTQGRTVLQHATYCGQLRMVRLLLAAGARSDSTDGQGLSPIHCAAAIGSVTLLETLLKYSTDMESTKLELVNRESHNGSTPLMCAIRNGHLQAVDCLLAHGADLNASNQSGQQTSLELAILSEKASSDILASLLSTEQGQLELERHGAQILAWAAKSDHVDKCRLLLDRLPHLAQATNPLLGIFQRTQGYQRPNEAQIAQMVLNQFPHLLDQTDSQGCSLLEVALQNGKSNLVQVIINIRK